MIKDLNFNVKNMKKIKSKLRSGVSLVLATVGLVTVMSGCSSEKKEIVENISGYSDINPFFNLKVKDNDFVILDVGDHDSTGISFQNKKVKYCNKNDISLGIVISSDAVCENEIYDDVELVKQIISNYTVDMPVYLNIDKIIENTSINVEQKRKLILDFLEKCSSNGIYCGIHGKDSNLVRVNEYCEITDYDSFVVMEDDEIKYDGAYHLYQDRNGKIVSDVNLATTITENKLNCEDKFVFDGSYVVGDNSIDDIAMQYGMSVDELLKFNDLKKSDIDEDVVLRIPCIIDKTVPIGNRGISSEQSLKGCDISHHQTEDKITWNELKENMDFVILKASDGNSKDDTFSSRAKMCNDIGIPIGAYCYNEVRYHVGDSNIYRDKKGNFDSVSFESAMRHEIEVFLNELKNKKIDYPCYLDIEANDTNEGTKDITKLYDEDSMKLLLKVWKDEIEKAGYISGIYTGKANFEKILDWYGNDLVNDFELWISGSSSYSDAATMDTVVGVPTCDENSKWKCDNVFYNDVDCWQVSECVTGTGISTAVDFNYSVKNYTQSTDTIQLTDTVDSQFVVKDILGQRNNWQKNIIGGTAAGGALVAVGATYLFNTYLFNKDKNGKARRKRK